jgi:hypothetical protein
MVAASAHCPQVETDHGYLTTICTSVDVVADQEGNTILSSWWMADYDIVQAR